MPNRQAIEFPLFPIPGWPGKLRFGQRVPLADLDDTVLDNLPGTTYGTWKLRHASKASKDSYTFHTILGDPAGANDALIVVWTPNVWTTAELATLSTADRSRGKLLVSTTGDREHSWPPVLYDLQLGSTSDIDVIQERRIYQDAITAPCKERLSVYVTDVRPTALRLATNGPIPGEISAYIGNRPVHYPECLHPYIEITSKPPAGMVFQDCTPRRSSTRPGNTFRFQPTNHTRLRAHRYQNDVTPAPEDPNADLWFITERTIFPPKGIPKIVA